MSLHWTTRALISTPIVVGFWLDTFRGARVAPEIILLNTIVTSGLIFWIIRPFIKPTE